LKREKVTPDCTKPLHKGEAATESGQTFRKERGNNALTLGQEGEGKIYLKQKVRTQKFGYGPK